MHETAIASSLIRAVQSAAERAGATKISVVKIAVGRLKAIETSLLEGCFEILAEDTVCEGAKLVSRIVPVTALCGDCGVISTITSFHFRCGCCASERLHIQTGRELKLESIVATGP